jgi:hypothetical protein
MVASKTLIPGNRELNTVRTGTVIRRYVEVRLVSRTGIEPVT